MEDLEEFDISKAVVKQSILDSNIFKEVTAVMKDAKQEHQLYLTCYLCTTIFIALSDKKIFQSELSFIVKSIPKNLPLEDRDKKGLVVINFERAMHENELEGIFENCLEYINIELGDKQKMAFLSIVGKLASIDGNIDKSEEELVLKTARSIGIEVAQAQEYLGKLKSSAKVIEGDKTVSSFSKLEKKEKPFSKKMNFKNLISRQKMFYQGKIEDSRLYFYINLNLPKLVDDDKIFLVSYIGVLFNIIKVDTIIHEKEIEVLKSRISQWFDFDQETLQMIVDLNLFLLKHQSQYYQDKLDVHIEILNNMLKSEQISDLCHTLIEISKADGQSVVVETESIQKIINSLDVPEDEYLGLCEALTALNS
jgi:uncharacterized tellurite resistance protein B-like protein